VVSAPSTAAGTALRVRAAGTPRPGCGPTGRRGAATRRRRRQRAHPHCRPRPLPGPRIWRHCPRSTWCTESTTAPDWHRAGTRYAARSRIRSIVDW